MCRKKDYRMNECLRALTSSLRFLFSLYPISVFSDNIFLALFILFSSSV
jgi:hypothetical protein